MGGKFKKTVRVTTNDSKHSKESLTCSGKVLVPFKANPRYARFQRIEEETTPAPATITIRRGDGDPLQLEVVKANVKGIMTELREIKAGEHYELIVALTPPMKPGKLRGWVKIKTGIKETPETTIPVYADIPNSWKKLN